MSESRAATTLFIEPGERVDPQHKDVRLFATASKEDIRRRWHSERGRELLRKLRDSGFERDILESSVGRLYENYDLRGIPLADHDLSNRDMHNIDFFAADLRGTKFFGCNLTNTHFSEADIRGADFSFSRMSDAFLDNANYDLKTTFTGVDLRCVNFNLAVLLQDQAIGQQRIIHLQSRSPILATFLRLSCNYGQSLGRWAICVVGTIMIFAGLYASFPSLISGSGLVDAIYFSVTTFSTLGFGDIVPKSDVGKLIVIIEVVLGYLMGGLLISILVRRLIGN